MLRVPEITVYFWIAKGLSTAMGEATSDYLVRSLGPVPAVLLGFVAFCASLALQFSRRRYVATTYWLTVAMVGVFGTMAADVLHVGLGVPYIASTVLWAIVLGAVFLTWNRTEGTLSVHSVDTTRRELFYWATVVGTFALGTAAGDLLAVTFSLGYAKSIVVFAVLILVPAIGFWRLHWSPVVSFWAAYVLTRPVGATVADWIVKSRGAGGLAWPEGPFCLVLIAAIAVVVLHLQVTRKDVQQHDVRQ